MSYINTKSNRSYDFVAPYAEEGERCQRIPFPVAVNRLPEDDTHITHDCNPQLTTFEADAAAGTFEVETQVQAGSLLIVRNESATNAQTIAGATCAAGKVTTLMWDGNGYITVGASTIGEQAGSGDDSEDGGQSGSPL